LKPEIVPNGRSPLGDGPRYDGCGDREEQRGENQSSDEGGTALGGENGVSSVHK
jgi:hypothetical protein